MKKIILIMLVIMVTACTNKSTTPPNNKEDEHQQDTKVSDEDQANKKDDIKPVEEKKSEPEDSSSIEDIIDTTIKNMSLEEKVGQLFIVDLDSLDNGQQVLKANDTVISLLNQYHPGGVIFFKNNIDTYDQTADLIFDLQQNTAIPLFVSVDEEGGMVARIQKNPNMHATKIPNAKDIGSTGNTQYAYDIGYVLGRELSALGFNMNFAPVADVNTNPDNPVIGVRAFGDDPNLVGDMVEQAVLGMQEQNISAVIKHFPGHGDTAADTHKGTTVVEHDMKRLREIEFIPFIKGMDADVDGIMIAHINTPNITSEDVPATLSREIVTDILREELGYNGLVITDALNMGAIVEVYGTGPACVKAVQAGVDILLMPIPFSEGYEAVLEAVNDGTIEEERINQSVTRILQVKYKRDLYNRYQLKKDQEDVLGSEEHQNIVNKITTIVN